MVTSRMRVSVELRVLSYCWYIHVSAQSCSLCICMYRHMYKYMYNEVHNLVMLDMDSNIPSGVAVSKRQGQVEFVIAISICNITMTVIIYAGDM